MELEEKQHENLRNNWPLRKDFAIKITTIVGYDLFRWKDSFGRTVFYIVRNETPVGYIAGYDVDQAFMIMSTFLVPIVRRKGVATAMYGAIIRLTGKLISDWDLSDGAKALWNTLMRDPTFIVSYDDGTSRYTAIPRR